MTAIVSQAYINEVASSFFIVLKTVGHERAVVSLHKIIILVIPRDNFMSMEKTLLNQNTGVISLDIQTLAI